MQENAGGGDSEDIGVDKKPSAATAANSNDIVTSNKMNANGNGDESKPSFSEGIRSAHKNANLSQPPSPPTQSGRRNNAASPLNFPHRKSPWAHPHEEKVEEQPPEN